MSKRKCYLAGGMCKFGEYKFNESNFWRVHIQEVLSEMPVEVCNPNDYFSFKDNPAKYKSIKEVMEFDLNKVRNSDFIIVNFNLMIFIHWALWLKLQLHTNIEFPSLD